MKRYFYSGRWLLAGLILAVVLTGCEIETEAFGKVTDLETREPIVGAHVLQLALTNKTADLISETYTDSLGNFFMDAGLSGFGARKVKLQIIVEKDSFARAILENNYAALNIQLRPY